MRLAEEADQSAIPDGMSIPEELKRWEERLVALAQAKAAIEARAPAARWLYVYRRRWR